MLNYNPPKSSNYSVDICDLLACIQSYFTKIDVIPVQFGYGCDCDVYLIGDFNFPIIDWTNHWSSSCHENRFLEMVIEKVTTHFVAERSLERNSILALVLSNFANLSVRVTKQFLSEHFPIISNLTPRKRQYLFGTFIQSPSSMLFHSILICNFFLRSCSMIILLILFS